MYKGERRIRSLSRKKTSEALLWIYVCFCRNHIFTQTSEIPFLLETPLNLDLKDLQCVREFNCSRFFFFSKCSLSILLEFRVSRSYKVQKVQILRDIYTLHHVSRVLTKIFVNLRRYFFETTSLFFLSFQYSSVEIISL